MANATTELFTELTGRVVAVNKSDLKTDTDGYLYEVALLPEGASDTIKVWGAESKWVDSVTGDLPVFGQFVTITAKVTAKAVSDKFARLGVSLSRVHEAAAA